MMIVSELEKEIYSLKGINTLNLSVKAIEIINNVAKKVKEYICCNGFKDIEEEILFFKKLKPILYSKLIYYTELKEIESKRVSFVSNEYVRVYLLEHTQRLIDYLNDNIYTYQYLKLGSTFLDAALFTRKNVLESSRVSDYDLDVSFMTVWDDKVSRIRACEMLLAYLNSEISRLDKPYTPSELTWHGSKRGLVQLIYALVAKECFGDATIKDLADFFQLHFNVDLGDYYGVYKEIKERVVKNRASFLSDLAEALLKRMDEDENS